MRNTIATIFAAAAFVGLAGCERKPEFNPASYLRHQVDPVSNRFWGLTPEGLVLQRGRERVELALPGWIWVGDPYSCGPALALGPRGEALITSNVVPTLWKVDPQTLRVSVHPLVLASDRDKDIGFSSLTYSSEHGAFIGVSDLHGSTWKIDPLLTKAEKIDLAVARAPCSFGQRPDGYAVRACAAKGRTSAACTNLSWRPSRFS